MKIYDESSSDFSLEFEGDNEIDAEVLVSTINELVNSLQYITTRCDSEAFAKIKITSLRQGSFDIDFTAIINFISNLCNKFGNGLDFANKIVSAFTGAIEIKKHLKGEKAKKVFYENNKSTIVNSDGEKLTKDRNTAEIYFENSRLDSDITNMFNIIVTDGTKTGLKIKSNGETVVEVQKDEFKDMSSPIIDDNVKISGILENEIDVNLLLKKPDLLGNSKWGFVLDKNIEATIEDEEWLKKVHRGEVTIRAGIKIPVKLRIHSELDENKNPIMTKYTVLKVTGNIIEPDNNEQLKLL